MELIFVSLIIVSGFSVMFYLYQKHLYKLEQLLKAKDLTEYKVMERETKEFVPLNEPEDLQDLVRDKSPDDIKKLFRN